MHFNEKLVGCLFGEAFKLPLVLIQSQCETRRINPETGLPVVEDLPEESNDDPDTRSPYDEGAEASQSFYDSMQEYIDNQEFATLQDVEDAKQEVLGVIGAPAVVDENGNIIEQED